MRGHFFSSECREKLNNLKALLAKCCDGKDFFQLVNFTVDEYKVPISSH